MSSLFKPWSGGVSRSNKVVLTQISQQLSYVPSLLIFAGVFLFLTLSLAVLPVGIFSRSSNFILIGCFSVSVGNECPNTCQSSPGAKVSVHKQPFLTVFPRRFSNFTLISARGFLISDITVNLCCILLQVRRWYFQGGISTYTKSIPTHLLGKMPAATRCLHGKSAAD